MPTARRERAYAEGTVVPAETSINAIQALVKKRGATNWSWGEEDELDTPVEC